VAYYLGKHADCERLLDWNKPEVKGGGIMTAVESIGATTSSNSTAAGKEQPDPQAGQRGNQERLTSVNTRLMNAKPEDRGELTRLRELREKLRDTQLKLENEILLRERGLRGRPDTLSCPEEEDKFQ
jgi:hypothetical protein